jgi:hypothetical protein
MRIVPAEYQCPTCNRTFRDWTPEAVLNRASAHNHFHHGGPKHLSPALEAALRGQIRVVAASPAGSRGSRLQFFRETLGLD